MSSQGSCHAGLSARLKFGVDRILSTELSPRSPPAPAHFPPELVVGVGGAPCSECVSSLLRCCRSGQTPYYHQPIYHQQTSAVLHTPKPIRPYSNMVGERDERGGVVGKRKRSWSRAVFSNLQRKGLEKRFQIQKYITKPDRRQLAATLGLTDAQVKVWFQNRRMKWRHTKEMKHQSGLGVDGQNNKAVREQRVSVSPPSPVHPNYPDQP